MVEGQKGIQRVSQAGKWCETRKEIQLLVPKEGLENVHDIARIPPQQDNMPADSLEKEFGYHT